MPLSLYLAAWNQPGGLTGLLSLFLLQQAWVFSKLANIINRISVPSTDYSISSICGCSGRDCKIKPLPFQGPSAATHSHIHDQHECNKKPWDGQAVNFRPDNIRSYGPFLGVHLEACNFFPFGMPYGGNILVAAFTESPPVKSAHVVDKSAREIMAQNAGPGHVRNEPHTWVEQLGIKEQVPNPCHLGLVQDSRSELCAQRAIERR